MTSNRVGVVPTTVPATGYRWIARHCKAAEEMRAL